MSHDIALLQRLGMSLEAKIPAKRRRLSDCETLRDFLIASVLRVRNKKRGLVPLHLNRAQAEFARTCTHRNIILKARQMGITTYVAARFFVQTITRPGTMTVQVAHDQESAEEIFKIVHRFWENLPDAMKRGALTRSRANVRQMVFPRLDSEYRVATAADVNAGRGLTIHNLHCSEVARWPREPAEALASLRAAVPAGGDIVLESTPNGAGGVFYEEWQQANETGYTRHFFPWWYDDEYRDPAGADRVRPLTAEEEELVLHSQLSDEQIAWRRTNRAQLRKLAAQEYAEDPVSCFLASGECIFELEAIDRALEAASGPALVRDNGRLTTWLQPRPERQYVIGVDPAGGGTEGDYACAEVIDRQTAMQCAELHGHYSPRELAMKVIVLARTYNQALLVVERNNHGYGVLANLRAAGYEKIFCDGGQDGWLTSAVTKPAMIENLAAILSIKPQLFQSERLLAECRTFIRRADGGSGSNSGSHDDCVMAMAIAMAARAAMAEPK
ncbi:MAG: terminase [Terriglobales bacterium]